MSSNMPRMPHLKKAPRRGGTARPQGALVQPKKIRSSPPDITVVVGKGDAREEFECYKVALSFASPYFDTMLAANMTKNDTSRIEFPTKDPNEWKMFYAFIDPSQIGQAAQVATIHDGNAMILVPWFQEFQMEGYFEECDNFLSDKVISLAKASKSLWVDPDKSFWVWDRDTVAPNNKQRKEAFEGILKLLQFSCIYELKETKKYADRVLGKLLDRDMLIGTFDLFDISVVKELTELFLPLAEEEEGERENKCKYFVPHGKSSVLWDMLAEWEFEACQLKGLPLEAINNNPMLPTLIKTFLESIAAQESRHNISESAREIIQDIVDDYPDEMYQQMPDGGMDARTSAKKYLSGMIKETAKTHKETFENLDVTMPDFNLTNDR